MKTKIVIVLIICGIAVSFGATKIGKFSQSGGEKNLQSSASRPAEPIGGFVSEDH